MELVILEEEINGKKIRNIFKWCIWGGLELNVFFLNEARRVLSTCFVKMDSLKFKFGKWWLNLSIFIFLRLSYTLNFDFSLNNQIFKESSVNYNNIQCNNSLTSFTLDSRSVQSLIHHNSHIFRKNHTV